MPKHNNARKSHSQGSKPSSVSQQVTDSSSAGSSTATKTALSEDNLPKASDNIFDDRTAAETWVKERSIAEHALPMVDARPLQYEFRLLTGSEGASKYTISCLLSNTSWDYIHTLEPIQIPLPSLAPTCFSVRAVGNRVDDHGLFATETIPIGAVIVSERPDVIFPVVAPLSTMKTDKAAMCRRLFDSLPFQNSSNESNSIASIMKLKNSWANVSCPEEGVMRTNGMSINIGPVEDPKLAGNQYSAIFPTISRCNHSCSPNAVLRWNDCSLSISLHAVQDILVDSEITIAYTDICESTKKRQALLAAAYGFKCTCSPCNTSKNQIEKRDKRLKSIRDWLADSSHTCPQLIHRPVTELEASLPGLVSILDIFDRDHLHSLRLEHMRTVDTLARIQGALGREDKFKEVLDQAIRVWGVDASWSPPARTRVTVYEKWKEDPRSFPLWQVAWAEPEEDD